MLLRVARLTASRSEKTKGQHRAKNRCRAQMEGGFHQKTTWESSPARALRRKLAGAMKRVFVLWLHGLDTHRTGPRKSGTQRPARIRRDASRFDAAETVQTPGAALSSGASGSLQHLQPPQFRPAHQLSQFPSIRAIDADVGRIAGKRRPEWRPQPSLSDRRPALGATGPEAPVLSAVDWTTKREIARALAPRIEIRQTKVAVIFRPPTPACARSTRFQ